MQSKPYFSPAEDQTFSQCSGVQEQKTLDEVVDIASDVAEVNEYKHDAKTETILAVESKMHSWLGSLMEKQEEMHKDGSYCLVHETAAG